MKNYQPIMSFDEETAAIYDQTAQRGDEAETVAFLKDLAGDGPALELAIGTGRIALPLAAEGVKVMGIDLSLPMLQRLHDKPGGEHIEVTVGNFADVPVEGKYRLIYLVFNTFFNLLTQDEQVRCFENVAKHLMDEGVFVLEGGVPAEFYRLRNYQYVDAEAVEVDGVRLDVARFDPVTQLLEESHITFGPAGVRLNPIVTRLVWPSELDLMARIAGLRLKERWASWRREPFTANSRNCISVYGR
ncbi:methylase related with ubiquinone/menaquinone biosynthesis [Anaerolinea thermolimosa]|nr:methylase related with ubiquinone/menaquinone biosynthesis [Anaerolinea thermolimosa]